MKAKFPISTFRERSQNKVIFIYDGNQEMIKGIQIFQEIGGEATPVRFAVEVDDVRYKLFSYFLVGRDTSIATQSYYKTTHSYVKRFDVPSQEIPENGNLLKISEAKKKAKPYITHKHTFHKSGIQNTKNRKGARFNDDRDIKSIPFDQIKDAIRLFYIYPTIYSRYPIIPESNRKHHNIFCLKGEIKKMPTIIEIRLSRSDYLLADKLKSRYDGFVAFVDHRTLSEKKLDIYTVFRKSVNPHFPSTEAFIREYY